MKVNVGTIGHIDHGKTTLTAALVRVLGEEAAKQVIVVDDQSHTGRFEIKCASALDEGVHFRSRMGKGEKRRNKKLRGW